MTIPIESPMAHAKAQRASEDRFDSKRPAYSASAVQRIGMMMLFVGGAIGFSASFGDAVLPLLLLPVAGLAFILIIQFTKKEAN